MSSATAGRVSKGVFVFRGKKKAAKCEEYFHSGSDPEGSESRFQTCSELLERTQEKIQLMQSELNTRLFDDLVTYVGDAHSNFGLNVGKISTTREIPTAALVTGVNTPDHDMIFGHLCTMVKERVSSYVALLQSKDCANLKSTMSNMIAQVMDNAELVDEDDEEGAAAPSGGHKINGTMPVLASWYNNVAKVKPQSPRKRKQDGSPRKQAKPVMTHPPVVIVIEDLESFAPRVIQDFITICSNHLMSIPFVFIFGIATTVTAIHRLLPQAVSSRLCMEKFQAPPSSDCLASVIQQILLAPEFPFKLGGRVFHILVDIFLYHDFSVLKFTQGFQYALLDHFYNNPTSVLCVSQPDLDTQVTGLSSWQLNQIRSIQSFRRYVERKAPEEQIKLLEDEQYTKACIVELLESLYTYNHCMLPVIMCLHQLVHRLPGKPLGNKVREIYGTLLHQNICDIPEYPEVLTMLKSLSRDELVDKLGQCVTLLTADSAPSGLSEIAEKLEEYKDIFINIEQLMQKQEESEALENKKIEPEIKSPDKVNPNKKMDLAQLKQTLQDGKKKKLTLYESTRHEVIDYLHSVFKRYLISPTKLPLHEIMYFNRSSVVKSCLNGVPRSNLEHGLSTPYYYLQREDMKSDGMAILPTLPDVCIAYKLHRECGRLINLYDWLQAFVMIVNAGTEEEKNAAKKKKVPTATLR